MDCPRCGSELTEIFIENDGKAVYCEECSFANIESKHTQTTEATESWEEAFRRFYGANREEILKEGLDKETQTPEDTLKSEDG